MLNVGGGELLIIFLVALVVLGPTKLPEAARQAGKVYSEFKKISSGFQREFRDAMKDPVGDAVRDVTAEAELRAIESSSDPFAAAEKSSVSPPRTVADEGAEAESTADAGVDHDAGVEADDDPPMSSDR